MPRIVPLTAIQRRALPGYAKSYSGRRALAAKPKPVARPKPRKPTAFEVYLRGDQTYLQQMAGLNRAKGDFLADQNLDRSQYDAQFNNTRRDLSLARTEQTRDIRDEYAGRGLLKSGIFNGAATDLNRKFNNQTSDLWGQRTQFRTRLQREFSKFLNEQGTVKTQAGADAARRRAERLGL